MTGAQPFGLVFAQRMRQVRKAQGMTQTALAARLAQLGRPISRSVLHKIEGDGTRARNVSLEDAAAIAAALNTSPLNLMTPDSNQAYVQVTPTAVETGAKVRTWLRGYYPLLDDDDLRQFFSVVPDEEFDELMRSATQRAATDPRPITEAFLDEDIREAHRGENHRAGRRPLTAAELAADQSAALPQPS
ncbi:MAG: helix-turn-helix domain-containing protein [Baekduiaceae bacterium]